ncbi:hypothetical protein LEP1GSC103_3068 [Leptospira borgpetersenii serovar Javanica str. UI 09931]|uniref:Uncharacterized protein n=5 Tax=Leptospira borgpetersenii TaxID=174 RepID=M3GG80_LEPBO|nr:hypothetical protein LBBP_01947 [Leptospira borgpetersenii serovar Ballum]EKP14099.1 hypothetical protein LEP1GSC128_3013 [Leptospira borgpetersenii str. 200801926]EKQ91823.1 hypothetical protein LEP1GSC101_3405 [Leptospira borgpetersenii str. UI 09149]EKR01869.1 hypothetical protein LEP1GSC121_3948 [Leptospira borgpetersenii serovar Castellonis str. 200801910]EMF99971.1 hypothetical protein LEP1GSC123_4340 [Leptospira borgpetersenii str. 200701203]EMK10324.1 hypothetical protein LEP1GSC066
MPIAEIHEGRIFCRFFSLKSSEIQYRKDYHNSGRLSEWIWVFGMSF